jgi:hypothetical protein
MEMDQPSGVCKRVNGWFRPLCADGHSVTLNHSGLPRVTLDIDTSRCISGPELVLAHQGVSVLEGRSQKNVRIAPVTL